MTPQTRALIEAAEAVVNDWRQEYHGLSLLRAVHKLEVAISSAKAAEDVPTLALMQIRDRQMQDRIDALELAFTASCPCGRAEALARIPAVQGMNK